jgi:uncharacterized protein YecT (DUF1311 family)
MKFGVPALLSFLFLAPASHVYALDCAKASSRVDKLICATPELKKTDEAMSAAYFKLLRETTDPDFHEALIRSQRRWLDVRSDGPDRFGQAESDTTDDRDVLLKMTRERLTTLRTARPTHMLELQRKLASEDGTSRFAGYKTYCVLQPPPYGNWTYECWGVTLRQHNDRICSSMMSWASGHMSEDRAVGALTNGQTRLVATCSTGDSTTNDRCPEADADVWTKLDSHWNTNPDSPELLSTADLTSLWKFDPDIDPTATDRAWMHDCLFSATYPPPDVSRASSKK